MRNENENENEKEKIDNNSSSKGNDIPEARDALKNEPENYWAALSPERKRMLNSVRKNLLTIAPYEMLVGGLCLILIWAILNPLNGMDIGYPYLYLGNLSTISTLGFAIILLGLVNLLYAVAFPLLYNFQSDNTVKFGYILCCFNLLFIPTGTYFGLYSLFTLRDFSTARDTDGTGDRDIPSADTDAVRVETLKKYFILSGFSMLHLPLLLLYFRVFIIMLVIDMAYPALASSVMLVWQNIAVVLLIMYLLQIIIGFILPKINNAVLVKTLGYVFAIFQILAFGIFIMGFGIAQVQLLDVDLVVEIIIYFSWIIGIILNPLGVHFGLTIIKTLKQ
jgi:hypothetical protein